LKNFINLIVAAMLSTALLIVSAKADERELIEMPDDVRVKFLTQMRGMLESVDGMLLALSEGDYDQVSKIADIELGFKHRKWQKMIDDGSSEDEVQAKINAMREELAKPKKGYKKKKNSKSMSRFMPANARAMGRQMHLAASKLSVAAQNTEENPDTAKFQELLAGVQEITAVCTACHSVYKVR